MLGVDADACRRLLACSPWPHWLRWFKVRELFSDTCCCGINTLLHQHEGVTVVRSECWVVEYRQVEGWFVFELS